MALQQTFSEKLKYLIKEKNLSLRKLEKDIKISHATLSRWLNGKMLPQAEYLCILADYFDCTVDYLLGRKDY